jgi:ketosteroid isomerase-like protein
MSRENVEVGREAFAAGVRGEVERFLLRCDDDVEFQPFLANVEGQTYRGHDAIRRWFRSRTDAFDSIDLQRLEIDDHGDVLTASALVRWRARGSGMVGDQRLYGAISFRGGKIALWGFYATPQEALEAVGLRE